MLRSVHEKPHTAVIPRAIWSDVTYAIKQLRVSWRFFLAAIGILGIGLGVAAAIFVLSDAIWLHPMPVSHPSEIVRLFSTTPQDSEGEFSYPEYWVLADRLKELKSGSSGLVAIGSRGIMMPRQDGTSQLLLTNVVSSNFFSVLGVHPLIGELSSPSFGSQMRIHPGVVISYSLWRKLFAGRLDVIGQRLFLSGGDHLPHILQVVAVLPPSFRDINPSSDRDIWLSTETWAALGNESELLSKDFRWLDLLGRLSDGTRIAALNSQVVTVVKALADEGPMADKGRSARVISDLRYRVDQAGSSCFMLLGIVMGVVALTIINVSQLLLARALKKNSEFALRISLGETQAGIVRKVVFEITLLVGSGALLAAGLASFLLTALPHLLVRQFATLDNNQTSDLHFQFDSQIEIFVFLLLLGTIISLSLTSWTQLRNTRLLSNLQSVSKSKTAGKIAFPRRLAIWLQIAVSFTLLVSTGILVRSFLNTQNRPIGISRNQIAIAFSQEPSVQKRIEAVSSLDSLSGVEQSAYAIRSPLMPSEVGISVPIFIPNHVGPQALPQIKYNAISSNFLDVIGTKIIRGNSFSGNDSTMPPEAIINQTMARRFWGETNPIGQIVNLSGYNHGSDLRLTIVGVSEDAPIGQISDLPEPYIYIPFRFSQAGEITFAIRTHQNAMSLAPNIRKALVDVDPILNPMFITSMPELIRYSSGSYQMMAGLVSLLATLALLLTMAGLYGFMAFRMELRKREIGIRMALGANRRDMAALILRDAAGLAGTGIIIGVALSFLAARFESTILYDVSPYDVGSTAVAVLVLSIVVLAAAWIPARRAATTNPMEVIRSD